MAAIPNPFIWKPNASLISFLFLIWCTLRVYLKTGGFNKLIFVCFSGKGRLYPAYSLSGSEGEESPRRYGSQHTYQHPLYQQPAGLSDTPTSENASDATLTDSELALARDSTLLVHNGKNIYCSILTITCGYFYFIIRGYNWIYWE